MDLADRLKAAREHAGLSQRELAKAVSETTVGGNVVRLSAGQVGKLETRERDNPDAGVMVAIARVCGVSHAWLVDGSGEMLGAPERTVELDGRADPRIAQVGLAIGATAEVIRSASAVRGAHGTAGLTDEDIARLLRTIAAADEQATAIARVRTTAVADDDDTFGPRGRRR